jgi:hypothetical protein
MRHRDVFPDNKEPAMRRAVPLPAILIASGLAGCTYTHSAAGTLAVATPTTVATTNSVAAVLYQNGRSLWSDQLALTRQYVVADFADAPTTRVALNGLERNQEAIGQIITDYYGQTAGASFTTMLKHQVEISSALIQAVKTGNVTYKEELERGLHYNSSAIARFLAGLNPNWSPADLESLFNQYYDVSARDVIDRKGARLDGDETAPGGSVSQSRQLADVLSDGIIRQFPHGPPYYPLDSH